MEGKKEAGSSSFSFIELFGPKDPPAPKGYFDSILGPAPPKVRESLHADAEGQDSGNKKPGDDNSKSRKVEANSKKTVDFGSTSEKQHGHSSNLSSSIYYGGPDIIPHSSNSHASRSDPVYNANGQDDSGATTIGNWWQGGVFY